MPEKQLLIDNLEYGRISINSEGIIASNSILYIPAELHLHPIKLSQHFKIDVLEYSLLLESSPLSKSQKNIHLDSGGPILTHDINFEFMIPDNNIKEIEKRRKGGDIELGINLNIHLELVPILGSKIEGKRTSATKLNFKIFRSQWEDIILPAFGYPQKKANSILFRTWEFLRKNWATILQLAYGTWDVVKDFLK